MVAKKISLRDMILSDKGRHVTIEVGGGKAKLEIREPSIAQRARYADEVDKLKGKKGEVALGKMVDAMTHLALLCIFDPGSGEMIFSDTKEDLKIFSESRLSNRCSEEVQKLLKDIKTDAGKESEETPSSASASSSENSSEKA